MTSKREMAEYLADRPDMQNETRTREEQVAYWRRFPGRILKFNYDMQKAREVRDDG